MAERFSLNVNGKEHPVEADPDMPLLYALRNDIGLNNPKFGCGLAQCGACTVHLDGVAVKSCTVFAVQANGREVRTIEGMAQNGSLHPLQEGFWEEHGLQCGYCTPGMIMSAADLLQRNPNPSEQEVRHALKGNLCRCTGYQHIVNAVLYAARKQGAPEAVAAGSAGATRHVHQGDPGHAPVPEAPGGYATAPPGSEVHRALEEEQRRQDSERR